VDLVVQAMAGIKGADIAKVVEGLSEEDCDTAMKYIYKCLAAEDYTEDAMEARARQVQCGVVLAFHAAIKQKSGVSSIVRVLSSQYHL
jgi:ARP2/3 complex 16 kDa subunit (p16-Arc)